MVRIGKFFLFLLIILICLEALVRLWGYSEMYLYDPIYRPCPESKEIPFVLKPNLAHVRAHGNIYINTDALGLRSLTPGEKYPPKGPGEYRIAIVGDSTTFGVGVATAATYPEVIQADLNRLQHRYRVRVFNFAESSYSVKEMTATLKYRVPAISPDLVIMGIIINDFDTGRTPGLDKWGYNTHGGASALVNQYPSLKLILRNIHLSYIVRDILSRTLKKKEVETGLMQGQMPAWIAQSYGYVVDFKKIATANGYQYLVVTLPTLGGDGSQFREIIANFKRDQIAYDDLSPLATGFSPQQYRASRYDAHPSARVHREIARKLSRYILEHYLDQPAPQTH